MTISEFCFFTSLTQKFKILIFQKKNLINSKFSKCPKKRTNVNNIHTNDTQAKFQSNIFIFGCAMGKKAGKGYDVTFLDALFCISNCRT